METRRGPSHTTCIISAQDDTGRWSNLLDRDVVGELKDWNREDASIV